MPPQAHASPTPKKQVMKKDKGKAGNKGQQRSGQG